VEIYIIKIQGRGKISDSVQIRDNSFRLVAYFKLTNPAIALKKCNLLDNMDKILTVARQIDYGKIEPLII